MYDWLLYVCYLFLSSSTVFTVWLVRWCLSVEAINETSVIKGPGPWICDWEWHNLCANFRHSQFRLFEVSGIWVSCHHLTTQCEFISHLSCMCYGTVRSASVRSWSGLLPIFQTAYPMQSCWSLDPIPICIKWEAGYTLEKSTLLTNV